MAKLRCAPKIKKIFVLASNELSFNSWRIISDRPIKPRLTQFFNTSGPAIDLRKEKTPNLPYLSGKPVIFDMIFVAQESNLL